MLAVSPAMQRWIYVIVAVRRRMYGSVVAVWHKDINNRGMNDGDVTDKALK